MIAIIDYGMGNLRSVQKALEKLGHAAHVTADPEEIRAAERVILPGVGAFGAAMANLRRPLPAGGTLAETVAEVAGSGKPLFGICLGMQLLLTESEELGRHQGLDLLPGRVVKFDFTTLNGSAPEGTATDLKIPHMGWNELRFPHPSPLFEGLEAETPVYFVHSFVCIPQNGEVVSATADHGGSFCCAFSQGNLHAVQFHPEKSGAAGLRILDNFARLN